MIANMDPSPAPDPRPLHVRVEAERKRRQRAEGRGWLQKDVAERAGIPLRTYSSFANGHTEPHDSNLRAILGVFEMEEDAAKRQATSAGFPLDVQVYLDMEGAWLETLPVEERMAYIHERTRKIIGGER